MGIAESMQKNMKQNMQNQMKFQKQLILKQRQVQLATQIALGRQRFWYYEKFVIVASIGLTIGAIIKKNPSLLGPTVPFGFTYAFQYDMLYGNMLQRAQKQADKLILQNPYKFYLPQHSGIVNMQQYKTILNIKDIQKE